MSRQVGYNGSIGEVGVATVPEDVLRGRCSTFAGGMLGHVERTYHALQVLKTCTVRMRLENLI